MTQFGYASLSTSPARRRIDAVGLKLVADRESALRETIARKEEARRLVIDAMRVTIAENSLLKDELAAAKKELGLVHDENELRIKRLWLRDIQREVCRYFNVSRVDFASSRRARKIVRPRQIAFYLARSLTGYTLPEIGRRFGNKDHTTVLHGIRAMERLMKSDRSIAEAITELTAILEPKSSTLFTFGHLVVHSQSTGA